MADASASAASQGLATTLTDVPTFPAEASAASQGPATAEDFLTIVVAQCTGDAAVYSRAVLISLVRYYNKPEIHIAQTFDRRRAPEGYCPGAYPILGEREVSVAAHE